MELQLFFIYFTLKVFFLFWIVFLLMFTQKNLHFGTTQFMRIWILDFCCVSWSVNHRDNIAWNIQVVNVCYRYLLSIWYDCNFTRIHSYRHSGCNILYGRVLRKQCCRNCLPRMLLFHLEWLQPHKAIVLHLPLL